ncbi:MAG: TraB/GumN family protein [Pseudomonadota bacterium]
MAGLKSTLIGLSTGLALLGACGAGSSTEPSSSATGSVSAPVERATAEELLADYQEALAKAQETQGPGSPALWSLSDEDTKIYIFGTVHLLRPEVEWRFPAFDAALDEADTVVVEVDMFSPEGEQAYMSEFLPRGMYEGGRTLRGALNADDEAVIEEAMKKANVPLDAFNTFEPWMVGVNIGAMQIVAQGYDPNSGVEKVVLSEAEAGGKKFAFLEDISDQADAFDLMSEASQVEFLYNTLMTLDSAGENLDHMVAEWADGDVEGLGLLVADAEATGAAKELYERVLVTRNKNWIPVIEGYLDEPGTFFIAAGSAHFAGPDSVILMLEEKGYTVERIN